MNVNRRFDALTQAVEARRLQARARLNDELEAIWAYFTDSELDALAVAIQGGDLTADQTQALTKFSDLGGQALIDRFDRLYTPAELAEMILARANTLAPLRADLAAIEAGAYSDPDEGKARSMQALADALHDLN